MKIIEIDNLHEDYQSIIDIDNLHEDYQSIIDKAKGRGLLRKCSDLKVSHFVGTQTRVKEDDCGIFFYFGEGRL